MNRRQGRGANADRSQRNSAVQLHIRKMLVLERLCLRFPAVAAQLEARHDNRPTLQVKDEHDLQDLLQALLALEHDDIRPRERPSADASGSMRRDFLLAIERIVFVAHYVRPGLGAADLARQVLADQQHYRHSPECRTLVCFFFDPTGCLANPRDIERTLSVDLNDLTVRVFVAPKA